MEYKRDEYHYQEKHEFCHWGMGKNAFVKLTFPQNTLIANGRKEKERNKRKKEFIFYPS